MTTEVGGGTRKGPNGHRTKKNGHAETPAQEGHARVPPHNIDAERSLLGGVLLDRAAPVKDLLTLCPAADFYRDAHRKIAEAFAALLGDDIPVDRVSVIERLTERGDLDAVGGGEYLELLENTPPIAANLAYYAKIVHDSARKRRLIEAGTRIAALAYESHGDAAEVFAESERVFKTVTTGGEPRRNRFIEAYQRFSVDELATDPDPPEFILKPYVPAEEVGNLAAPGGSNKTTLLTLLAASRALGRRMFNDLVPREGETIILTTEDRKKHYLRRLAALREHLGVEWNSRAIAERIHLIDMYGIPVRLIAADRGEQYVPTQDVEDLAECLRQKAPRADHVIIETISRVTGGVENNASMTVLVNACERLCMLANVAVTLVGHVGQNTARAGIADAYSSRGGSSLGDNGRASMVLQPLNEKNKKTYARDLEISEEDMKHILVWAAPKVNSVQPVEPRFLRRLSSRFGPLLVDADLSTSTSTEEPSIEAPDEARVRRLKKGESRTWPQLLRDIVACVDEARRPLSGNEINDILGGSSTRSDKAVKDLVDSKHLAKGLGGRFIPGTTTEPIAGTGAAEAGSRSQFPHGTTVGGTGESEEPTGSLLRLPFENHGTGSGTGNRQEEPPPPGDKDAPL